VHLNHADDPKSLRDMEVSKVPYKLYTATGFLAVVLASGMAFLMKVKGMRLVDAFYCVCATVTTLGYGDRSFSSTAGRAFAAAWITVSTLVVALFFLYAAELAAERRQRELAHWVLTRRTTSMDLEAADLDGDHRVSAAEFALYKLKELGKISQRRSQSSWRSSTSSMSTTLAPSRRTTWPSHSPDRPAITGRREPLTRSRVLWPGALLPQDKLCAQLSDGLPFF